MRTKFNLFPAFAFCLLFVLSSQAQAQAQEQATDTEKYDPNVVLAYQGEAVLTQAAIDASFTNVPEEDRLEFIRDGAQVDRVVVNLLRLQVLAIDARKGGFDKDPVVQEKLQQVVNQTLATLWLNNVASEAEPADYEALANEQYLANPEQFKTEEMLDVSHILIGVEDRSPEEAIALAQDLHQRLVEDPSQFEAMVEEYSDDPAKVENDGRYPLMRRGQMAAAFETAAFELDSPGDFSELVETNYGYHIIRLNRKYEPRLRKYSEVKDAIIKQVEAQYKTQYKARYLQSLLTESVQFPPGAIDVMARRHFGDDLELAPDYYKEGHGLSGDSQ